MDNTARPPVWVVKISHKAVKQLRKLPPHIQDRVCALRFDLEYKGPVQLSWRNYGLIVGAKDVHHCHLNTGRPRYVVVWKVVDKEVHVIEIRYVGTHGKVQYNLFT